MKQPNKFRPTILEGIGFALLGTIYTAFIAGFIEVGYNDLSNQSRIVSGYRRELSIGWLWIFVGLFVSYFFIRFFGSGLPKVYFWLFTVIVSSISTGLLQNLYLTDFVPVGYAGSPDLLSYWLIPKVFVILIPFTFLYANLKFVLEILKKTRYFHKFCEGIGFVFFGSIYTFFVSAILTEEIYRLNKPVGLDIDEHTQGLGLPWILVGTAFSYLFCRFAFREQSNFAFWFFVVLFSSISAFLLEKLTLPYIFENGSLSASVFSAWWIPKMFVLLIPFTFLFANWRCLIDKIRNRNPLR